MFLHYFNISVLYDSRLPESGVVIEYRKLICTSMEGTQMQDCATSLENEGFLQDEFALC